MSKSWNAKQVSLWVNNDEGLYNLAKRSLRKGKSIKRAAEIMLEELTAMDVTATPDGAPYTLTALRAAISSNV